MSLNEKIDLSQLDFSSFKETVNKPYSCVEHEGCILVLTEVVELAKPNDPRVKRVPFVLVFKAPSNFPIQQAVYELANEELGQLEVFLVPVASSEEHVTLEATFT
jgi:hypothetical protein